MSMSTGKFYYHDSTIIARCDNSEKLFRSLMRRLQLRGYTVMKNPRIERDYKSLSKFHRRIERQTSAGLFECDAEFYPAGMKLECYQNINFENPNGGRYDFNRVSKMPFLIRMRFLHFRKVVTDYLVDAGLTFKPGLRDDATPLERFNDCWTSERFKRDSSGWPDDSELDGKGWSRTTRDGVMITQGMSVYTIDRWRKRWKCGQIFGGINGMWQMYNQRGQCVANENARYYWAYPSEVVKGRVKMPEIDGKRFKEVLDKAYKAGDWRTVERMANRLAVAV